MQILMFACFMESLWEKDCHHFLNRDGKNSKILKSNRKCKLSLLFSLSETVLMENGQKVCLVECSVILRIPLILIFLDNCFRVVKLWWKTLQNKKKLFCDMAFVDSKPSTPFLGEFLSNSG